LRSDAQRREYQDLHRALREVQGVAAERDVSLAELREWATLLEQEEEVLRRERQQLRHELEAARQRTEQMAAAQQVRHAQADKALAEAAAKLAELQESARQTAEEFHQTQDRLVQTHLGLQEWEQAATAQRTRQIHAATEAAAKLANAQEVNHLLEQELKQTKDRLIQTEYALRDLKEAATAQQARAATEAAAKLADSQDANRRLAAEFEQIKERLAQTEQTLGHLQPHVAADAMAIQSFQEERSQAQQSIETLTRRCTIAEQECERLRQYVSNQGDVVTLRRPDYQRLLADREAKKRFERQLGKADAFIEKLRNVNDLLEQTLAQRQDLAAQVAAWSPQRSAATQRWVSTEPEQALLRSTVEQLKAALATAEQEKTSLRGRLQDQTAKLENAEKQQTNHESTIGALREELANAQAQLRSRQSAENTQIAVAGLKEAGKIGLRVAVALAQNKLVKDFQQESSAAQATKEPSQLERLIHWKLRIPAATQQGWKVEQDALIAAKRDELKAADQLAKLQTSLRIPPTARALPFFPSIEDLALLEALDARSAFYRRHGGQWIIEFFQLDPKSEEVLRWDSVEAMAGINAERNKLTRGTR
jgi:chromosome segregation ATPase